MVLPRVWNLALKAFWKTTSKTANLVYAQEVIDILKELGKPPFCNGP